MRPKITTDLEPHAQFNGPIRRAGCSVEADDLKAHVLTQLARFKVPRDIVFVDDLPRTALGKVQHFMLRQLDVPPTSQGGSL